MRDLFGALLRDRAERSILIVGAEETI